MRPPLSAFRVDAARVFMVDPGTAPASAFESGSPDQWSATVP
jgi:hypothetical protein